MRERTALHFITLDWNNEVKFLRGKNDPNL